MKELTKTYGDLLQDKRVRSEQARYESYTRQRNLVLTRYKKIFQAFSDLIAGLTRAQSFYSEMQETVESVEKNVESFVNNRRSEGAQLLNQIERDKATSAGGQADRERDRLRELMERMSMGPSSSSPTKPTPHSGPFSRTEFEDHYSSKSPLLSPPYIPKQSRTNSNIPPSQILANSSAYQGNPHYGSSLDGNHLHSQHQLSNRESYPYGGGPTMGDKYNPMAYPFPTPASLPPSQGPVHFTTAQQGYSQHHQHGQYLPQGYVPPPPPPGPPPSSQPNFGNLSMPYPSGPGGYAHHQPPPQDNGHTQQSQNDPWAGLNAWK